MTDLCLSAAVLCQPGQVLLAPPLLRGLHLGPALLLSFPCALQRSEEHRTNGPPVRINSMAETSVLSICPYLCCCGIGRPLLLLRDLPTLLLRCCSCYTGTVLRHKV